MADARQAELTGLVEAATAAPSARGPWRGLQLGAATLLLLGVLAGAARLALTASGAEAPRPRAPRDLLELTASEGDTSALLRLDGTQQAVVNKLIDRQVALAQTGSATSSPTRSDFEELGGTLPVAADRALKKLDSSTNRKLTGPRVGYKSPFPEDGEDCHYPTGAEISCISGYHCCDSLQIAGAAPAKLYSICCPNEGVASQCVAKIFFVSCEDPGPYQKK
ncbi:unnamed protein product [Prorocentrum cordatum]|uniref:Uncharacterized protein n=1 Tax=Prorocentrum cordatum TaxID=2364126 RepID=A0ABN9PUL7_9DINO|nr:unnamed protein product [Polarella glacialis]|mmetsp:Transcript_76067/g.201803  ORF Transcript_76067/g.201803 Transcript_76067/m.201803 type:complete len:222 (+) Transcript_76067:112-777(+)